MKGSAKLQGRRLAARAVIRTSMGSLGGLGYVVNNTWAVEQHAVWATKKQIWPHALKTSSS